MPRGGAVCVRIHRQPDGREETEKAYDCHPNEEALILVEGDDDQRRLSLHLRKMDLERLLARRPEGIFAARFEQGGVGPDLFRAACKFGLDGLVSKRTDRPYRRGRSPHWIKVKNRNHPAMARVTETFRQARCQVVRQAQVHLPRLAASKVRTFGQTSVGRQRPGVVQSTDVSLM
jgi:hypothetical protein